MNSVYFIVGLLDCTLGFALLLTGQYLAGTLMFLFAFLLTLGIKEDK